VQGVLFPSPQVSGTKIFEAQSTCWVANLLHMCMCMPVYVVCMCIIFFCVHVHMYTQVSIYIYIYISKIIQTWDC
jgi:hypothetical protein